MTAMTVRTRALVVLLALSALALVWAGGFVLSSQDGRCTDGAGARRCSGRFSSDVWHGFGLAAVATGLATLAVAAVITSAARRRTNTTSESSDPEA